MKISKRANIDISSNSNVDDRVNFSEFTEIWREVHSSLDGSYTADKKSFYLWFEKQKDVIEISRWNNQYIKNLLMILAKENSNVTSESIFKSISLGHSIFMDWWKKNYLFINNLENNLLKNLDSLSISIDLNPGFWTDKELFFKIYKSIISFFGDKIVENKYQINIDDKINLDKIIEESKIKKTDEVKKEESKPVETKRQESKKEEPKKEKSIKEDGEDKKSPISSRSENLEFSDSFFGGKQPEWYHDWDISDDKDLHGGRRRKSWHSNRAWDIAQDIGTPIYSLTNGRIHNSGQRDDPKDPKIFGFKFTVIGDEGFPNVWYTHTKNPTIKDGDRVVVGQKLAEITRWNHSPKNSHVHVALETGYISELMDESGRLKKLKT